MDEQERQGAYKPDLNPYTDRGMIRDPRRFYGREAEMEAVLTRLRTMQSISVVGQLYIGKSSFLYQIVQTGPGRLENMALEPASEYRPVTQGQEYTFCYLSLEGIKGPAEFYERSLEMLGESGQSQRDLEQAITGRRLVLCLDEFEGAARQRGFGADFFGGLRSMAQTGRLALVVATQTPLDQLIPWDDTSVSPFFNIFVRLDLGWLTKSEAQELATIPVRLADRKFEREEITRLLEKENARHPYYLQLACHDLFEEKFGLEAGEQAVIRAYDPHARPPKTEPTLPAFSPIPGALLTAAAVVGFISTLTSFYWGFLVMLALLALVMAYLGLWLWQAFRATNR